MLLLFHCHTAKNNSTECSISFKKLENFWITKICPDITYLTPLNDDILEVLIPNPDLDFWNSDPKIHFWANLGPKIQSCPFCLKIGAHSISRMLIPNPDLDFWNFDPKIYFWANLGQKIESCRFCLKIVTKMLILILTLIFWISNSNFLFGQIWAKKVKVLRFNWKLTHMVSWKCRFRIRT